MDDARQLSKRLSKPMTVAAFISLALGVVALLAQCLSIPALAEDFEGNLDRSPGPTIGGALLVAVSIALCLAAVILSVTLRNSAASFRDYGEGREDFHLVEALRGQLRIYWCALIVQSLGLGVLGLSLLIRFRD